MAVDKTEVQHYFDFSFQQEHKDVHSYSFHNLKSCLDNLAAD